MNHRHTDRKVRELEREIKRLKQSLDITIDLNEVLHKNNNKLDKERVMEKNLVKEITIRGNLKKTENVEKEK